jgi:hypothetical protein
MHSVVSVCWSKDEFERYNVYFGHFDLGNILGYKGNFDEFYIELFNLFLQDPSFTYRRIESFEKHEDMARGRIPA